MGDTFLFMMQHGVLIAYYLDRHSVFRVSIKDTRSGMGKRSIVER